MAAKFVKHKDIDPGKWDNCISNAANRKIYALYNYLNIACECDAIVYNDYEAVMPLPFKTRLGVMYLYQPFFCQQLGVFHTKEYDTKNHVDFFALISKLYKYGNIQLNYYNHTNEGEIIIDKKHIVKNKTNQILNLADDYHTIFKNYSVKCKQSIKKGYNTAANITVQNDIDIALDFYKSNYGHRTPHVQMPDFDRLSSLLKLKEFNQEVYIYNNPDTKQIEAVSVFIIYDNQIYYMLSAAIGQAKQNCALFYMMDEVIKKYSGRDYILDFEGSMIPAVARFNIGFGAVEQTYFDFRFSSNFSILGRRMLAKRN